MAFVVNSSLINIQAGSLPQDLAPTDSPQFQGLKIDTLNGILHTEDGVVSQLGVDAELGSFIVEG